MKRTELRFFSAKPGETPEIVTVEIESHVSSRSNPKEGDVKHNIPPSQAMAMILAALQYTCDNWDDFVKFAEIPRNVLLDGIPDDAIKTDEEVKDSFIWLKDKLFKAALPDIMVDYASTMLDIKLTQAKEAGKL